MNRNIVRVGIIGAGGFIGKCHLKRLHAVVEGAEPVMIFDIHPDKIMDLAEQYDLKIAASEDELIASPEVDAVLITSWDGTHAALTKKCIDAGKPVFCEKPLATTVEDCASVVRAEKKAGKRMVQVGFMRRFDPDYQKMKKILDSGELGAPVMAHCISRTPRIAKGFTDSMQVTNILIHEIDQFRWLFGEEIVKGQMIYGRPTGLAAEGLHDPQLALMWTKSGVLIDVECSVNSYYGYEIGCEIVCEKGTIRLPLPASPIVRSRLSVAEEMLDDWSVRFPEAYNREMQSWIDSLRGINNPAVQADAPGTADGYAAAVVSDFMIRSLTTGKVESSKSV